LIKKGDQVMFDIGDDETVYEALTDSYIRGGVEVVDLKGYPGEVNVAFLKYVGFCDEGKIND